MKTGEFETMARVEDGHWWYGGLRRIVLEHWRLYVPPGPATVLDAGCGTGSVLRALAPAFRAIGVDCSPVAVGLCRQHHLPDTAVASVARLPFADATFEVVISCDVLCHEAIRDCAGAVAEMGRVLKPGGLLLMNLPAYPWLLSSHDTAVANVRRFSKGEVWRLLQGQALSPLRLTYWNTLLFPPIAAVRLWRRFRPRAHSDLKELPLWGNAILATALAWELTLLRLVPSLPLGISLFAAARKMGPGPNPARQKPLTSISHDS